MNKEGYWISVSNNDFYKVDTHEKWIQNKENALLVGIPEIIYEQIESLISADPVNIDKVRLIAIAYTDLIRMRAHDSFVTFEYAASADHEVEYLKIISHFLKNEKASGVGPQSVIKIYNLKNETFLIEKFETLKSLKLDWQEIMKSNKISYYFDETRQFAEKLFNV